MGYSVSRSSSHGVTFAVMKDATSMVTSHVFMAPRSEVRGDISIRWFRQVLRSFGEVSEKSHDRHTLALADDHGAPKRQS